MASTTAGTNGGSSAFGGGNRRACRRQVNTCCGVSPCRRAISETTAPGTSVSSMIRALSSLENQRRRPVSVITSSRPAVASELSVWSSIDTRRSLQRDRETRPSHVPREGGSGTTLTQQRYSTANLRLRFMLPSSGKDEATCAPCTLCGERHSKHAFGRLAVLLWRFRRLEFSVSAGRSPLTRRSLRCDTLSLDAGRIIIAPPRSRCAQTCHVCP